MKQRPQILAALALAFAAGAVQGQASANDYRCQELNQAVTESFNAALKARVPKEDPGTFVQNGYDIKGIMSTDTTSGLSKLLSGDWSGFMNALVTKGVQQAVQRGSQNFSGRVNGLLSSYGVSQTTFAGVTNWGSTLPGSGSLSTPTYVPPQPVTAPTPTVTRDRAGEWDHRNPNSTRTNPYARPTTPPPTTSINPVLQQGYKP